MRLAIDSQMTITGRSEMEQWNGILLFGCHFTKWNCCCCCISPASSAVSSSPPFLCPLQSERTVAQSRNDCGDRTRENVERGGGKGHEDWVVVVARLGFPLQKSFQ